jgi:hypothetical protein
MKSISTFVFWFLAVLAGSANGQPCVDPIQFDKSIQMTPVPGASTSFLSPLENGSATVSGVLTNRPDGETVQIDFVFNYKTEHPISFDELIECIEGRIPDNIPVLINTNLVNLNPNRGTLAYSMTLRYPRGSSYQVRLRVWGNYE